MNIIFIVNTFDNDIEYRDKIDQSVQNSIIVKKGGDIRMDIQKLFQQAYLYTLTIFITTLSTTTAT